MLKALTAVSTARRQPLRHRSEGYADPIFLDPDNSAFVDRGVLRHHQFKARRDERGVLHIDGGDLRRAVSHHAAHNGTNRQNIRRFVEFGAWVHSLILLEPPSLTPRSMLV